MTRRWARCRARRDAAGIAARVLTGALWIVLANPFAATRAYADNHLQLLRFETLHGDLGLGYERSGFDFRNDTGNDAKTDESNVSEELNLRERIVVYHPRLIDINLSLGVRYEQGHRDREGLDNTITRYATSIDLLKQHPLATNLLFSKEQREFEQSPTVLLNTDEKVQRVRVAVQEEGTGLPIPLTVTYQARERTTSQDTRRSNVPGRTLFFEFSDESALARVDSFKRWSKNRLRWHVENEKVIKSRTVVEGTTKYEFERDDGAVAISGVAGSRDRFRWNLDVRDTRQSGFPESEVFRTLGKTKFNLYDVHSNALDLVLDGEHSRDDRRGGALNLAGADEPVRTIETNSVLGGVEHRLFRSLFSELKRQHTVTTFPDFERIIEESTARTTYFKTIPDGTVNSSYAITLRTLENSGLVTAAARAEVQTLVGFVPVVLDSENIVVTSIVVTDRSGTIPYVEGLDYRVFQLERQTSIERIPGTRILNSESVLVDYDYSTPRGTLESRLRNFNLGAHWRFLEPYARFTWIDQQASQGAEELLNPGKVTVGGLRLKDTLWNLVTPEYLIEQEHNRRLVTPFDRTTREAKLVVFVYSGTTLELRQRQSEIDRVEAGEADSVEISRGYAVAYARGRIKTTLGLNEGVRTIANEATETTVILGTFTIFYGQWVLESRVRNATERLVERTTGVKKVDNESNELAVSVKREF